MRTDGIDSFETLPEKRSDDAGALPPISKFRIVELIDSSRTVIEWRIAVVIPPV